jgi:hypothetical protein
MMMKHLRLGSGQWRDGSWHDSDGNCQRSGSWKQSINNSMRRGNSIRQRIGSRERLEGRPSHISVMQSRRRRNNSSSQRPSHSWHDRWLVA